MDVIGHFITITEHRIEVMKYCFKCGLYFQGLTHDLSKYAPVEFLNGARFYQGYRSPNNAERENKGYSEAWLHHKGRNRHHYEYWVDYCSEVSLSNAETGGMVPVEMPRRYLVEMICDRVAASKVYNKGHYTDDMPLKYFERSMNKIFMNENTKRELHAFLKMIAIFGEERTFKFIKERYLRDGCTKY
ncbi:MAG: DUF5662 family protein [Lachnospiraceae bacterium]|nr:DUF5662 family protein [Lachnospiraceae bacterium]